MKLFNNNHPFMYLKSMQIHFNYYLLCTEKARCRRFLNLGSDVTEFCIRLRILQIIIRAPALLVTSTFGSRGKFGMKQLSVKKTVDQDLAEQYYLCPGIMNVVLQVSYINVFKLTN